MHGSARPRPQSGGRRQTSRPGTAASFLASNRVVFNVVGNTYRRDTRVAYRTGVVVVKRIGTHAQYDRCTFND